MSIFYILTYLSSSFEMKCQKISIDLRVIESILIQSYHQLLRVTYIFNHVWLGEVSAKFELLINILSTTSFSLINLHQKFFSCQPEMSHGAEADCLTLLKVTAVLGAEFIDWVEDNYYKFRHCNAMWNMLWLPIK